MRGRTSGVLGPILALAVLGPASCGASGDSESGPPGGDFQAPEGTPNLAVFIPGGILVAGSDDWREDFPPGSPFSKEDEERRTWTVEGFWIQRHEVTNFEYRVFDPEHEFPPGKERHPVVGVSWREAMAYAMYVGGTLPNDVQWEFAARGEERRTYPWGHASPTCDLAHYADCEPRGTVPVMSRPGDVTPEGVHDLAGNVREWATPVWFDPSRYPENHEARLLKGGSFRHPAFFLRAAALTKDVRAEHGWDNVGFRVAWPALESAEP